MPELAANGSCLCGAVHFAVSKPYQFFQYCHCSRCRKRSGSAHCANILIPVGQLQWIKGKERVKQFELPSAKMFCTAFCTECGSALPWITRDGKWALVPAGALDDDPGEKPQRNIYCNSRPPWYAAASELPEFEERP